MTVVNQDVVKAVIRMVGPDEVAIQNSFSWIANFVASQTDAAVKTAIETFLEDFFGEVLGEFANDVVVEDGEVSILQWDSEEGAWLTKTVLGVIDPDITFTGGDDPLPNAVAANITAKTLRPRTNGRKALGPIVETMAVDNNLTAAAIVNFLEAGAHWLTDLVIAASNTLDSGVYRRGVNAWNGIVSVSVPSVVGSCRSRKPGVGS